MVKSVNPSRSGSNFHQILTNHCYNYILIYFCWNQKFQSNLFQSSQDENLHLSTNVSKNNWYTVCIYRPWPKKIHLPALVPKLILPTLAAAMTPDLYLPVQVKILLLPQLLLVLFTTSIINITATSTTTTTTILLMKIIITKDAFVTTNFALNGR